MGVQLNAHDRTFEVGPVDVPGPFEEEWVAVADGRRPAVHRVAASEDDEAAGRILGAGTAHLHGC